MGYLVETAGRVLLPRGREAAALEALTVAMNDRQGWFREDDPEWPITSLADLATFAATSVTRDGDWLVLATDEEGDPKWSEQATALYAELYADLNTRLERNRTEHRLAEKRSKRDVDWSDDNVRQLEQYVMNTGRGDGAAPAPGERLLAEQRHLRLDNSALSADETAERILAWLDA